MKTTVLCLLLAASASAGDIRALIQKAKPAVVQIATLDQAGQPLGYATGFFITPDGYLLTDYHVISGATSILARSYRGTIYHLRKIAAASPETDVVELQFDAKNVPYLTLGSTANTVEGQRVLVIGNPEGYGFTVSDGIISAFRDNRATIQVTAPISHGSSGSPVLDAESGQVLGIIRSIQMDGQNLNFAISSESIRDAIGKALTLKPTAKSRASPAWTPPPADMVITPAPLPTPVPVYSTPTPPVPAATPVRMVGGLVIWFLLFSCAFRSKREYMWWHCAALGTISGVIGAGLDWYLMHSGPEYSTVANNFGLMAIVMVADFAIALLIALAVCLFGWMCRWLFIWRNQKNHPPTAPI